MKLDTESEWLLRHTDEGGDGIVSARGAVSLPGGPARPLDAGRLTVLIREALFGTARELRGKPVENSDQLVYRRSIRPHLGYEGAAVSAPLYRKSIWEVRAPATICAEAKALTDYIWDAGALPKTLSRDDGGIPGKDAWVDFVWTELVQAPFLYLCWLSASKRLSETGTYEPWHIDATETEAAAHDLAQTTCWKRRSVNALCPIMWASIPGGIAATLAPGIYLREWTLDEKCLFLTRFHQEYRYDDLSTWLSGGLLEINFQAALTGPSAKEEIVRAVTGQVDLVKWALMVAADSGFAFGEGGIVLHSPSGWRGPTIRRQDPTFGPRGSRRVLAVNPSVIECASKMIPRAKELLGIAPELGSIFSLLGRSHTSSTSRDSLLEAAIGLESLLVPDPGESNYKFRLHGATLLSSVEHVDVDKDLKRIYELRSKAHGNTREEQDFEELAPRSRFLLAKAIFAAIQLTETGELKPNDTKGDLGQAMKELVRRRCLLPQRVMPPANPILNSTSVDAH